MRSTFCYLYLLIAIIVYSCSNDDDATDDRNPQQILSEARDATTALLTGNTTKIWRIESAILLNGGSQLDISELYNTKDDEFIFGQSEDGYSIIWHQRYGINMDASTIEESLLQRYSEAIISTFTYAEGSATEVVADSLNLSFSFQADQSLNAIVTGANNTTLNLVLVEKTSADYQTLPASLNFTKVLDIETDLIGAPGMTGSYADNSLFITLREARLGQPQESAPERIIKIDIEDNSVIDHVYDQGGFASRQCHVIGENLIVVGGTRTNIYKRENLDGIPISIDFPWQRLIQDMELLF